MPEPRWLHNPELFERELAEGHRQAITVAEHLQSCGLHVEVTPMVIAQTVEERQEFLNEHDLTVGLTRRKRIDVKSRRLTFSGPEDFPYHEAFVDTVAGWEAKTDKPAAIVCISQWTACMVVIPVSTYPQWRRVRRWDRVRKIEETFYVVDRQLLRSIDELADWLRRECQ